MVTVLLGILAALLGGSGLWSRAAPQDRPAHQFDLAPATGGPPVALQIEPYSELKFKHIVHQAYDYSCGSAALVTLLNYYLGLPVTEQQSMEGMMDKGEKDKIIARRGFSLLDMKRYVASLGVTSAGFKGELKDLATLGQPAIVPIDYAGFKHFVVLRGIRDQVVYVADPAMGNMTFSLAEFASLWDGGTLFVVYPPAQRRPVNLLALSDNELGVVDMDRVKDHAQLGALDNAHAMERLLNGVGGISIHRQ